MNTRTIQPKLVQQSQYCASTTLQSKKANQEADESTGSRLGRREEGRSEGAAGRPEEENQDKMKATHLHLLPRVPAPFISQKQKTNHSPESGSGG